MTPRFSLLVRAAAGLMALFAMTARAADDTAITSATAEMQILATAEGICALAYTTYYVSLETLNDSNSIASDPPYDYLNYDGGTYVIAPRRGLFLPSRVDLLNGPNPYSERWDGPYVTSFPNGVQTAAGPYDLGTPLDPWGNPYYLFTPLGLARGDIGQVTFELYGDLFDQYTIVSAGPNGVIDGGPNGASADSDDIRCKFGSIPTEPVISSLREPPTSNLSLQSVDAAKMALAAKPLSVRVSSSGSMFYAAPGDALLIRGYNLGTSQGTSRVLFGKVELTDVRTWSKVAIVVGLPVTLAGTNTLTVEVSGVATNGLLLSLGPRNAAHDWTLYETDAP